MSKLRFNRFGLIDDPRGGHCTYRHGNRLLIGEVVGVERSEHRGFTFLKVKHFDGTPWPFDPIAANVEMLEREFDEGEEGKTTMIAKITKAYVRTYSDNGQTTAYVEWVDGRGRTGRTEGKPDNVHMLALLARAKREGVEVEIQTW